MKTRKKPFGYVWYGTWEEDEKRIREYCFKVEGYDRELLHQICCCVAPGLGPYIFNSLTIRRNGYDMQMRKVYIPATKADFYGYQRKALAEFYRMLKLLGRWKED